MENPLNIVIAGAGSIGCFVGGLLLHNGHRVSFLARERMKSRLEKDGLRLTSFDGVDVHLPAETLDIQTDEAILGSANIIMVCVKSAATTEIADTIANHAKCDATIISLQNGINNARVLSENLPEFETLGGMVPFNVVQMGENQFHRGTSGHIVFGKGKTDLAALLTSSELEFQTAEDMQAVQCGKLLINLNNALNALSGLTLHEQLGVRNWRCLHADQISEALNVFKAANIKATPPSPVSAGVIPYILKLPTTLFRIVAKQMLSIDKSARSSMWEDLQQGRTTEVDELQGVIVELGEKHDVPTPVTRRVMERIKEAEKAGAGSPGLSPDAV